MTSEDESSLNEHVNKRRSDDGVIIMSTTPDKSVASPLFSPGSTSKSAFKPVIQRQTKSVESFETFESKAKQHEPAANLNPRGSMTKELLTAQLRNILSSDNTGLLPNSPKVHKESPGPRKLPLSPDQQQLMGGDRSKPVIKRSNSTGTSSRTRIPSPMRGSTNTANLKHPPAWASEANRSSPSDKRTTSRSNSRIPTPSSLHNTSFHATSSSSNQAAPHPPPNLARRGSLGTNLAGMSASRIPTLARRPASTDHQADKKAADRMQIEVPEKLSPEINEFDTSIAKKSGRENPKRSEFKEQGSKVIKTEEDEEITSSLSSKGRKPSVVTRQSQQSNAIGHEKNIAQPKETPDQGVSSRKSSVIRNHSCERNLCRDSSGREFKHHPDNCSGTNITHKIRKQLPKEPEDDILTSGDHTKYPNLNAELLNMDTKHSEVISEAFKIIGKYFPEKQMYAHMFAAKTRNAQAIKRPSSITTPRAFARFSTNPTGRPLCSHIRTNFGSQLAAPHAFYPRDLGSYYVPPYSYGVQMQPPYEVPYIYTPASRYSYLRHTNPYLL